MRSRTSKPYTLLKRRLSSVKKYLRGTKLKSRANRKSRDSSLFFFEMSDYLPELDKTLDYFFDKVVLPGDSLIVMTPMKNYHLRSEALAQKPKEKVKEQLRGILRRDILMGGSEYRNTIDDMRRILATPPMGRSSSGSRWTKSSMITPFIFRSSKA